MKLPRGGLILIPKIGEKIEKVLEKLSLKPEISPREFLKIHKNKKHRYFSPCLTESGERVIFFARLHFNLDAKSKFKNEIKFLKKAENLKLSFKIPRLLDFGIEKDFEWLVREYPQGKTVFEESTFPKMIPRAISEISGIKKDLFFPLKKFKVKRYLNFNLRRNLVKSGTISKDLSEKLGILVKKNFPILKKENEYFCHGDLNPKNIIIFKDKLWIIDWEAIHQNNFAFDIAYFWVWFWKEKEKRKFLIKEYLKNLKQRKREIFQRIFPLVVAYFCEREIRFKKEEESKEDFEKRKETLISFLENCAKGFENLISA
jgi:tRNA A-37 threonylcarbamoyl transferase component Bud32